MIYMAHFKEFPEQKSLSSGNLLLFLVVVMCVCVYMRAHSAMLSLFYKWDS